MSMIDETTPNAAILAVCEEIKNETWKSAQSLSKGGLSIDHGDVRQMVIAAMQISLLREIRSELMFSNHEKRMAALPFSMFNIGDEIK